MIRDYNIDPNANISPTKILGGVSPMSLLGAGPSNTRGQIYYVNKDGGSDSFDGKSPDKPFLTIANAITVMNGRIDWTASPWARHDLCYVYPGKYAENLTALGYGNNLIGLGNAIDINGENGVTVDPASGSAVDVTSVINARISNICFEAPDTSVIFESDNCNRNVFDNLVFQGLPGASPTTTRGFEVVKDMTGSQLLNSWFNQIRNAVYLVADNANSKQITGDLLQDLTILGGDQTGIHFDVNCVPSGTIINRCNIAGAGATLALGLDDNTGIVTVMNTNFEATACDPASGDGDSKYNNCYLNGSLMT